MVLWYDDVEFKSLLFELIDSAFSVLAAGIGAISKASEIAFVKLVGFLAFMKKEVWASRRPAEKAFTAIGCTIGAADDSLLNVPWETCAAASLAVSWFYPIFT